MRRVSHKFTPCIAIGIPPPRSYEMPSRPLLGTDFSGWAASWMSARTNRGLDGPDRKKRMAWWNNLVDLEIGQMMVNLITVGYSMDIRGIFIHGIFMGQYELIKDNSI